MVSFCNFPGVCTSGLGGKLNLGILGDKYKNGTQKKWVKVREGTGKVEENGWKVENFASFFREMLGNLEFD